MVKLTPRNCATNLSPGNKCMNTKCCVDRYRMLNSLVMLQQNLLQNIKYAICCVILIVRSSKGVSLASSYVICTKHVNITFKGKVISTCQFVLSLETNPFFRYIWLLVSILNTLALIQFWLISANYRKHNKTREFSI